MLIVSATAWDWQHGGTDTPSFKLLEKQLRNNFQYLKISSTKVCDVNQQINIARKTKYCGKRPPIDLQGVPFSSPKLPAQNIGHRLL